VHVSKSFGSQHALRDIEFGVPAGQICGLVGPNGAG
jgi:ABC-2 type transport system ATP-binding protein/sodium transport system ATP-binding protein